MHNSLQEKFAERLGKVCGYDDYSLFLINSGAEANENAMKLASFATGKSRILAFSKAFHGRTSLAVEATDNPKIVAPVNANGRVTFVPFGDVDAATAEIAKGDVAAVPLPNNVSFAPCADRAAARASPGATPDGSDGSKQIPERADNTAAPDAMPP